MLDWSSDVFVSAYFAAESGMWKLARSPNDSKRISLWAFSPVHFNAHRTLIRQDGISQTLAVVDVPSSENPNLRNQRGRFTLQLDSGSLTGPFQCTEFPESLKQCIEAISQSGASTIAGAAARNGLGPSDVLHKLTLPWEEAPVLMWRLHRLGYSAARIYPGLKGCEQTIGEMEQIIPCLKERWSSG